jgi:pimeloyl-ACP methyl ester carboxylesterase
MTDHQQARNSVHKPNPLLGILQSCLDLIRPRKEYSRMPNLVLLNGLAEQPESWFRNRQYWERYFDVKVPELLVYDGPVIARRIEAGLPVTVPFFAEQLELFLDQFVQMPPYHLVASSLGCQVAVEYAARHPDKLGRMVLLCPSGVGGQEKLPVAEGLRSNNFESLVASVFHSPRWVDRGMVRLYERQFVSRQFRKGLLRTVRGTSEHSVRDKLPLITRPVLVVCGEQDSIVDPASAREAIKDLPNYHYLLLPRCGHAPQIEKSGLINRVVRDFLLQPESVAEKPVAAAVPS